MATYISWISLLNLTLISCANNNIDVSGTRQRLVQHEQDVDTSNRRPVLRELPANTSPIPATVPEVGLRKKASWMTCVIADQIMIYVSCPMFREGRTCDS